MHCYAFFFRDLCNNCTLSVIYKVGIGMEDFATNLLNTLPLFQGIGRSDLAQFSAYIPHKIMRYYKGEIIAADETMCDRLIVAFSGEVEIESTSTNSKFAMREKLQTPVALQPEALYGIRPRFTYTFKAETEVKTLEIPKEGVTKMFSHFEVFRLNLANMLSTMIYRQRHWLWRDLSGTIDKRIVNFIHSHCLYPAGEKLLLITMEDFGGQINETRFNVACALKRLEREGLVRLKRKKIFIPCVEKLIQFIQD